MIKALAAGLSVYFRKKLVVYSPVVSQRSHIDIHGCGVGSRGALRNINRRQHNRHNNVYWQRN